MEESASARGIELRARPFRVEIAEAALDDLRWRLHRTTWPDELLGSGWELGTNLAYLKELVEHWRTAFDWRKCEEALNAHPQFLADVGGTRLHFIHARAKSRATARPLLITHGWPSSVLEMQKLLPLLTDPAAHGGDERDAFDVVVPSLPGCGFSERPGAPGMTKSRIAELWTRLMIGLGYDRFFAHGGDIGAGVTTRLGLEHADRIRAIHVTAVVTPYLGPGSRPLTEAERAYAELCEAWYRDEGGYDHIQATRPQTLAYALGDSPVGLAAWIVEKFRSWSDCDGDVESRFSKDELLANVALYWLTGTIGSSMRLYYEQRHRQKPFGRDDRVRVPTAVALTTEPIELAPREWAERSYDLRRYVLFDRGGHFLALEEPELLAADLRNSFRELG